MSLPAHATRPVAELERVLARQRKADARCHDCNQRLELVATICLPDRTAGLCWACAVARSVRAAAERVADLEVGR